MDFPHIITLPIRKRANKSISYILLVLILLIEIYYVEPLVAKGDPNNSDTNINYKNGNNQDLPSVDLYFFSYSEDTNVLETNPPENNVDTIMELDPMTNNRIIFFNIQYVGTWESKTIIEDLNIGSTFSIIFWAQGSKTGVYFTVWGSIGNFTFSINTNIEDLSSEPKEFTANLDVEDKFNLDMKENEKIEISLYYTGSTYGNAQLVFGSKLHNAHITIECDPIIIYETNFKFTDESLTITASFLDIFKSDFSKLVYLAQVNGPRSNDISLKWVVQKNIIDHRSSKNITAKWFADMSKAPKGKYNVTISIGYDNNYLKERNIEFDKTTNEGNILPFFLFTLLISIIGCVIFFIIKRRKGYGRALL